MTREGLDRARQALETALAREGGGPPLIGDKDLRVCLAAVSAALEQKEGPT